ncbi:type II toxin-antitoxin system PrlF family antitoxin [Tardiphaga sp.]|uniref:type II toxin-antitoxin system PrlF family antitoxin n=1 Tax=Tardiphaga sp. TaxID=1926292 RepID=UPI00352A9B9A
MPKTAEILEIPATITERGQTTVPAAIRKMLALGKRDRVVFRGLADGTVVLAKKAADEQADPVIGNFLRFLEKDMAAHPARVRAIPSNLLARGAALVKGVEVDLDAALPDDDA